MQIEDLLEEEHKELIVVANSGDFMVCDDVDKLISFDGDLPKILQNIKTNRWENIGQSYDRFIVFGENSYFKSGKSMHTKVTTSLNIKDIQDQRGKDIKE